MRRCAIMQPTYMPWAGYFHLIGRVDTFVFLDDAQFVRRSWHQRNRVLLGQEPHWLTVPVRGASQTQRLCDVEVDDTVPWRKKHLELLRHAYARHPHGAEALELAQLIADPARTRLAELNMAIIEEAARRLELRPRFVRSSALELSGKRTAWLVAICEALGCTEYVSPPSSAAYLAEDGFEAVTDVALSFSAYEPAPYPQARSAGFVSHMSILDVVANVGWHEAARYVQAP